MKKQLLLMTLLITMSFNLTALDRAAVVPFAAGEGVNPLIASDASRIFFAELETIGKFEVVGDAEVCESLNSLTIKNISQIDEATAINIGKKVNADKVFIGKLSGDDKAVRLSISVKCVDVQTGETTFDKNGEMLLADASLEATCRIIASQIANNNTNENIYTKDMSDKQLAHLAVLTGRGVNVTNGREMKSEFNHYLKMGISGAVLDAVLTTIGAGIMGGFMGYAVFNPGATWAQTVGGAVGGALFGINYLVSPILCVLGFVRMGRTFSVYRRATGNKKFIMSPQISLGGGYNWENKEIAVGIVVKL